MNYKCKRGKILKPVNLRATKLLAIKLWELFVLGLTQTLADCACKKFCWNGQSGRLFLENFNFDSQ